MSGFTRAQRTILPSLEPGLAPGQGYGVAALMAPPPPPPSLPSNIDISTTKRRRAPKAPTKSKEEWNAHRSHIHRLYVDENLPLEGVMKAMSDTYGFHAS